MSRSIFNTIIEDFARAQVRYAKAVQLESAVLDVEHDERELDELRYSVAREQEIALRDAR